MNQPLRPYALVALAAMIVGLLENVFFGADHGGIKHDIAVGFFLLLIIGAVALIAIGVVAITRRVRSSRIS